MMNREWTDLFRQEIPVYAENIYAFDRGDLNRNEYKGKGGGYGTYAQKDPHLHMLRLRMAGGRLTMPRLAFLCSAIENNGIDKIKLTTCEAIQLHDLTAQQVPQLMEQAIDAEIYTRGGGGDNPRNVMMSPLAGVQQSEAFDVVPYVEAAAAYLLGIVRDIHMPRKLKVAFCNGVDDCCHAAFRDMGFIANPDGTFALNIAGGLGNNHRMGVRIFDALPANDVIYALRAMIDTFCEHGCYTNRGRARTRYMQETLGPDGLKAAYLGHFETRKAAGGMDCAPAALTVTKTGEGVCNDRRAIAQKQSGLYAVSYHPLGGMLPAGKPAELYAVIRDMDAVECRVSPDGTLYIINLTAAEAEKVLAVTADGAASDFECSTSCVGSSICQQGMRNSQAALAACRQAVAAAELPADALPAVAICGCPSSCAAPQAAAMGFMGAGKNVDGKPQSAFKMFLGGSDAFGKAVFGEPVAVILESELPAMLVELGRAAAAAGQSWSEFKAAHEAEILAIIAKYN